MTSKSSKTPRKRTGRASLILPEVPAWASPVWHLFVVRTSQRDALQQHLAQAGVGTSLHLAHGSARFSEDLDFRVRGGLSLQGLSREVQKRLRLPPDIATDLSVTVTPIKDAQNPHSFYVTLAGTRVIGSAKVKIELWQTPAAAAAMLARAIEHLRLGMDTVRGVAAQPQHG